MNNGVQLISIKYKPFWKDVGGNYRKLFLISDSVTREEFLNYFKTSYEELDLRTVRIENDYGNFIQMKNDIVLIDSDNGMVTLEE